MAKYPDETLKTQGKWWFFTNFEAEVYSKSVYLQNV